MKKEILKMERVKINEEEEYQGEWTGGKREAYGIMFTMDGVYSGHRYEGEFNEGKADGKVFSF